MRKGKLSLKERLLLEKLMFSSRNLDHEKIVEKLQMEEAKSNSEALKTALKDRIECYNKWLELRQFIEGLEEKKIKGTDNKVSPPELLSKDTDNKAHPPELLSKAKDFLQGSDPKIIWRQSDYQELGEDISAVTNFLKEPTNEQNQNTLTKRINKKAGVGEKEAKEGKADANKKINRKKAMAEIAVAGGLSLITIGIAALFMLNPIGIPLICGGLLLVVAGQEIAAAGQKKLESAEYLQKMRAIRDGKKEADEQKQGNNELSSQDEQKQGKNELSSQDKQKQGNNEHTTLEEGEQAEHSSSPSPG